MKQKYIGSMAESTSSEPLISVCQLPFLLVLPSHPLAIQKLIKETERHFGEEALTSPAPVKQMHLRQESNCRQV